MTTDEDIQILGIQAVSEHDFIHEHELKLILSDGLSIVPFIEQLISEVTKDMPNYLG